MNSQMDERKKDLLLPQRQREEEDENRWESKKRKCPYESENDILCENNNNDLIIEKDTNFESGPKEDHVLKKQYHQQEQEENQDIGGITNVVRPADSFSSLPDDIVIYILQFLKSVPPNITCRLSYCVIIKKRMAVVEKLIKLGYSKAISVDIERNLFSYFQERNSKEEQRRSKRQRIGENEELLEGVEKTKIKYFDDDNIIKEEGDDTLQCSSSSVPPSISISESQKIKGEIRSPNLKEQTTEEEAVPAQVIALVQSPVQQKEQEKILSPSMKEGEKERGYNYTFQDYLHRHKYVDPFGTTYRHAYQNLLYNIDPKRNPHLHKKLMEESITGHQLVRMSFNEIASPQTKQKIKEVIERGLKQRTLKEDTSNYTYLVYTCSECGGTTIKLTYIRRKLQADRFRTIGTCVKCKYTWDIS